jgi:sugar lactone lactonase YvrE
LNSPIGIYINVDQSIYIADVHNHRIIEWKSGTTTGKVVAAGNGQGNKTNQLNYPRDVVVDKETNSLIISDRGNKRVVRWSLRNETNGQTIISNIDCNRLTMDNNGYIYVSDYKKHEVRRWKVGETNGTLVAGGNGQGHGLNQLNHPTFIFVDEDHSVYVSDCWNHRVMKWIQGAKEGTIVAGGQGTGNALTQLSRPQGLFVDHLGTVYVADCINHRIMRWSKGSTQGNIILGGNWRGEEANQFIYPMGLSFDRQGNLYVVDNNNHRVQRFNIDRG